MASIRLSKALALSCLISSALFADIHDRIEYKLNRVLKDMDVIINGNADNCTPINQLEVDQGGGVYTISESGLYCVTEDIVGYIFVDADCVCIELGCHTIDADGNDNAIVGFDRQGLKVFNGCITNSAFAGISLSDYAAVELSNLHMHDYEVDGISLVAVRDAKIHNVDFTGNDIGERAVFCDTCRDVVVSRCNASGFVTPSGGVVEFDVCKCVVVENLNLCDNICPAGLGAFECANVAVTDCVFNNNASETEDGASIRFADGSSAVIKGCLIRDTGAFYTAAGISASNASELVIEDTTINGTAAIGDGRGIAFDSVNNSLIVRTQIHATIGGADASGIYAVEGTNVVVQDTNVYGTSAEGEAHGILFDTMSASKIIRSQVHENTNAGVELIGDNDSIAIIESIAMYNDIGFDFTESSTASCCLVQDCRAISNETYGFVHATSPVTTTFIGNEGHCNGELASDSYSINGVISLQELDWGTGDLTVIDGNAVLGARFTNLRAGLV